MVGFLPWSNLRPAWTTSTTSSSSPSDATDAAAAAPSGAAAAVASNEEGASSAAAPVVAGGTAPSSSGSTVAAAESGTTVAAAAEEPSAAVGVSTASSSAAAAASSRASTRAAAAASLYEYRTRATVFQGARGDRGGRFSQRPETLAAAATSASVSSSTAAAFTSTATSTGGVNSSNSTAATAATTTTTNNNSSGPPGLGRNASEPDLMGRRRGGNDYSYRQRRLGGWNRDALSSDDDDEDADDDLESILDDYLNAGVDNDMDRYEPRTRMLRSPNREGGGRRAAAAAGADASPRTRAGRRFEPSVYSTTTTSTQVNNSRVPGAAAASSATTATATAGNSNQGAEDSSIMDRKPAARKNDNDEDNSFMDRKPAAKVTAGPSSDRRTWLDALRSCAATRGSAQTFWTSLPSRYQADKEFVLTALRHFPSLPDKSSFERAFPQALRFDKDVVLAFCARDDFKNLYDQRLLYPPHCLTNDKDVMLAYCKKIPRALQECSEELVDDADVVRAALELDGYALQYASPRLKEDYDTVKLACQRDGRALQFCPPGPLRTQLCQDRDFMISVMPNEGGPLWRMASPELKDDPDLLREALANGLRLRFCPAHFRQDVDFLCTVLERNSSLYLEMNKTEQAQQVIAVAAITSPTSQPEVHERALQMVPTIRTNRDVVLAVAQRGNVTVVTKIFLEANEQMQDDKEIVLAVLSKNVTLFNKVSARLKRDNDILVAAMDASTALSILKTISPAVQEECPQIPEHAIKVASSGTLRELRRFVQPATLWADKRIAMAWVGRGQPCMPSFAPFYGDQDFALKVAEHVPFDFGQMRIELRGNKSFMHQALALNGRVLRHASTALQSDYDLLVRAVATSADALWPGCPVKSDQLLTHLNDKLKLHQTFVMDFLRGIAISDSQRLAPSRRSALPLLDRGVETSQAFKRLIAEMLGVPLGKELAEIRQAQQNISDPALAAAAASATAAATAAHAADAFAFINNDPGADDPWMLDALPGDRIRARHALLLRRMMDAVDVGGDGPNAAAQGGGRGMDLVFGRRARLAMGRPRNRAGLEDPDGLRWGVRGRPDPANPVVPVAGAAVPAAGAAPAAAAAPDRQVDVPVPPVAAAAAAAAAPDPMERRWWGIRREPFRGRRFRAALDDDDDEEEEADFRAMANLSRARLAEVDRLAQLAMVDDEVMFMQEMLMGDEEDDMIIAAMQAHDRAP